MNESGITDTEIRRERMKRKVTRIPRAERVPVSDDYSGHDRNLLPAVVEGVKLIDPQNETFAERQERLRGQRKPYASMRAHQEMAATVLAAGGSMRMASLKAGVSIRQVKKYYTEPDFRKRIEEMRSTMFQKVRGRVVKELEKRTRGGMIDRIELLDLLRIFDRVYGSPGGKGGSGVNIAGDINVTNTNYDTLVAQILAANTEAEGGDFPSFELDSLRLPEANSPE